MYLIVIAAVAVVIYMLIKKMDIKTRCSSWASSS